MTVAGGLTAVYPMPTYTMYGGPDRYYSDCGTREATTDVQLYERADADMPPTPSPFYVFAETRANSKCTTNVASTAGHWGPGHTLETCQEVCMGVTDCNFVTHDIQGYCR
jgi:hypothetical protein